MRDAEIRNDMQLIIFMNALHRTSLSVSQDRKMHTFPFILVT